MESTATTCPCGRRAPRLIELPDGRSVCRICRDQEEDRDRRRAEGLEVLENLEVHVQAAAERIGLAERERGARVDLIPAWVGPSINRRVATIVRAGGLPPHGAGLVGTTGTGKSFGWAALVLDHIRAKIQANAIEFGAETAKRLHSVRWVNWPLFAKDMRSNRERADEMVEDLARVPLLILDDIGAERRTKANYQEEFVAGQLDLLVDMRDRDNRPTLWTANVKTESLAELYGARLVSRLCGRNPAGPWIEGRDLRLRPIPPPQDSAPAPVPQGALQAG